MMSLHAQIAEEKLRALGYRVYGQGSKTKFEVKPKQRFECDKIRICEHPDVNTQILELYSGGTMVLHAETEQVIIHVDSLRNTTYESKIYQPSEACQELETVYSTDKFVVQVESATKGEEKYSTIVLSLKMG